MFDNRVCAKISKSAILHNIENIRKTVAPDIKIMPVIKADGYGHGVMTIVELTEKYADYFAVATIGEAIALRENSVKKPILVLGHLVADCYKSAVLNDITITVCSFSDAQKISRAAKEIGKEATIHIAVDTGMGRIGFFPDEKSADTVKEINNLDNLYIEGVFTHFALADSEDKAFTKLQMKRFKSFQKMLSERNVKVSIYHASNSAAILRHPECALNMVRPGIILYGLKPSPDVKEKNFDLIAAMEIHSHVAFVKNIKAGDTISYGSTFVAKKDMKIATIPVGYADGYPRLLSNKGRVIINGKYAPITGRICMDQFMVDVTDIENVKEGDLVVLMGKQGSNSVSADEIAQHAQTINYEIVCNISKRVPREVVE